MPTDDPRLEKEGSTLMVDQSYSKFIKLVYVSYLWIIDVGISELPELLPEGQVCEKRHTLNLRLTVSTVLLKL